MAYKPGESGNLSGRPRHVDPRSQELQGFCKEHGEDIRKVGEIALKKAVKDEEPWAIRLCMEYFYPKPGVFVAVSREESREISVKIDSFASTLSLEDRQTFLRLWMKSKKGIPAFSAIEGMSGDCIGENSPVKDAEDAEDIETNTDAQNPG